MHDIHPGDVLIIERAYSVRPPPGVEKVVIELRAGERVRVEGVQGGPPHGLVRVGLIERPEVPGAVLLPWTAVEGKPIWRLEIKEVCPKCAGAGGGAGAPCPVCNQ